MGKSKKTKQKDFVKKKLKVGKTKQPANNATNLSFQSKQIRINDQILFDNDTVFENKNLTRQYLAEKLGQLNNNSDSVRLDAVGSLKSILDNSPSLMVSALSDICASIAKVSIDLDNRVGKEVHSFCSSLFDLIEQDQMIPFFHIFLVYICSGVSHISERVRLRSLSFSKLLISHYPQLVARNTNRLLPHFLQLLCGRGSSSTATNSLKFRDEILERVEELWSLHASSLNGLDKNHELFAERQLHWNFVGCDVFTYPFLAHTSDIRSLVGNLVDQKPLDLGKKSDKKMFAFAENSAIPLDELFSNLIAFWIESVDFLLQETELKQSVHLKICSTIMNLLCMIWPNDSPNEKSFNEERRQMLQHVAPNFPFGARSSCRDEELSKMLTLMNMKYCKIACHLALTAKETDEKRSIIQPISDYVLKLIKAASANKDLSVLPFELLFQVIESRETCNSIHEGLLLYQERQVDSDISRKSFSLIIALNNLIGTSQKQLSTNQRNWILGLPKQLWKLKNSNERFSLEICEYIKRIVTKRDVDDKDLVMQIQISLIPLFTSTEKSAALFTRLALTVQLSILDLLYYIPVWDDILQEKLVYCCFDSPPTVNLRVFDIAKSAGLKCSLLIGASLKQLHERSRTNNKKVFDAVEPDERVKNYESMNSLANFLPPAACETVFKVWHDDSVFCSLSALSFCSFLDIVSYRRTPQTESLSPLIAEYLLDAIEMLYRESPYSVYIVASIRSFFQKHPRFENDFISTCCLSDSDNRANLARSFIDESMKLKEKNGHA